MKLKKCFALFPALALTLSLSTTALACGHAHGHSHWERPHICADANGNGLCDSCGGPCAHQSWGRHGHHGGHC